MFLHFLSRRQKEEKKTIFRNFIFGVEDSLVSTVGLLAGVAAAHTNKKTILTTGIVLIFVEAFSMGVGSFLSEETAGQLARHRTTKMQLIKAGFVMFVSYLLAGLIPLSPYAYLEGNLTVQASILSSLIALFVLGYISARKFKGNVFGKAVEMFVMGGLATLVGIFVGNAVNYF